jgi:hypothetical protein
MFTTSAGINCFIILKLDANNFCITLISFDKCEHFCKWTARMVPLGTPAVAILYILTSRTRFRSWSFYRYRKRFGDLDHCFSGPSVKTALVATSADSVPSSYLVRITIAPIGTTFGNLQWRISSKMATIDECIEFVLKNIGLWWRYTHLLSPF